MLGALSSTLLAQTADADSALPPPSVAPGAQGAQFTPIVSQLVSPPTPFKGDDGRQHLAFELMLTDISPRDATVTDVIVKSTGPKPVTLQHLSGTDAVAASMTAAGSLTLTPAAKIPSYATNQLLLDAIVPPGAAVPTQLAVTIKASFAAPQPGQPPYVSIYPDTITEALPRVSVSPDKPIVIPSPLGGGDWMATNSCCQLSSHRGAMNGASGKAVFPERYAIDFIRAVDGLNLYTPGQAPSMTNNYSYGAKLLAVAPATVIAVQNGIPDQPAGVNPTGYSLNQLGGNYIVLKLRDDLYALYGHISPGTLKVKVGDKVKTGQVIGLLGNSGNSTAPHLHFHLMNGPGLLTSDGVPFEFERMTVVAKPDAKMEDLEAVTPPRMVTDAYPLTYTVVRFPGASGARFNPGGTATAAKG